MKQLGKCMLEKSQLVQTLLNHNNKTGEALHIDVFALTGEKGNKGFIRLGKWYLK